VKGVRCGVDSVKKRGVDVVKKRGVVAVREMRGNKTIR